MTTGRPPRVAIVGARRVRTGLGPFLAKHLVAHGAEVPAFIASRPETIDDGRASLRSVGVDAEGFLDLDALLDRHPTVDALVIATPHHTHAAWLRAAITRGLHVLCEKPLVWGDPPPLHEGVRLIDMAAERNVVLFENCPWPYALPAFDELHPQARRGGVYSFVIEMAPSSSEPSAMLVDTLSHPLSVLQEFARLGEAITPIVRWQTIEPGRIEMAFSFHGVGEPNAIETVVRLHSVPAQPRPMALVINGFRAERRVRLEDYALSWTAAGREVPIPDPMAALVGDFVRTVRDGETRDSLGRRMWRIQSRLKLLWMIMHRFPAP